MPTLNLAPARPQDALPGQPFARWRAADGTVVVEFHRRDGAGYLVRFINRGDFSIDADLDLARGAVAGTPVPGVSEAALRDVFAHQVVPMIRGQAGELAIHASGVAIAGAAVAFVGETGRGKSTLAAACARDGLPFLSDDGIYLVRAGDDYLAQPNAAGFRMWQDSASQFADPSSPAAGGREKARIAAGESLPFCDRAVPLRALYFLGDGSSAAPAIAPLGRPQALAALINHVFLLDVEDRVRLRQLITALGELVDAVACFSLDYPREFTALPCVVAAIRDHAFVEALT